MTLTQLRYIIAIADTGHMNEAAKKPVYLNSQSLSLAVKELEKEIGTRLLREAIEEYQSHKKGWNS